LSSLLKAIIPLDIQAKFIQTVNYLKYAAVRKVKTFMPGRKQACWFKTGL
jgi:hypothetical protein